MKVLGNRFPASLVLGLAATLFVGYVVAWGQRLAGEQVFYNHVALLYGGMGVVTWLLHLAADIKTTKRRYRGPRVLASLYSNPLVGAAIAVLAVVGCMIGLLMISGTLRFEQWPPDLAGLKRPAYLGVYSVAVLVALSASCTKLWHFRPNAERPQYGP